MKVKKLTIGLVAAMLLATISISAASKEAKQDTIVLTKNNLITLNSQVDGQSVSSVISKAKELDSSLNSGITNRLKGGDKAPLYLFLNTPGGSIQAGLELIETLKGLGRPVNTVTLFAASMGFQIAQNLDERYIIKNGVLMSHRARGGFEGEFGGQTPSQIESRFQLWMDRLNEMDQQTVNRTKGKQTLESYQKAYASELWITGTKSVEQGYADKVVSVKCDSSLSGTTQHELSFFGIPIQYELDNCPLNTSPMNIKIGLATNQGVMNSEEFLSKGGQFGPSCLTDSVANKDKLCALDTRLNMQKVKELKTTFTEQYESKLHKVVYMYW
jgi:ATP-dependent Clp protease protease subunit